MIARCLILTLLLLGGAPLWSAVVWSDTSQTLTVRLADAQVRAVFHFTNQGTHPVAITNTASSCGCTVVTTSDRAYTANEQGEIAVVFAFGSRRGLHTHTATVTMTDTTGASFRQDLTLTVDIPDPRQILTISHQVLTWEKSGPPEPRTVLLTIMQADDIHVTGVEVNSDRFQVTPETLSEGRGYRFTVTPGSTSKTVSATLTIVTDAAGERFRRVNVPLLISEPAE